VQDFLQSQPLGTFPERLETARLILARPGDSDRSDLLTMHSDPHVMATLGGLRTPEELDGMNQRLLASWDKDGFGWWIARHLRDARFVGRGGLKRVQLAGRDEVEVGYGVAREFWGQGLAGEIAAASIRVGFQVLGVPELVCFTLTTNSRSKRVMEKAGFRYERAGEYASLPHVFYRLRREDWNEHGEAPPPGTTFMNNPP
jgi:[ribosomal protein S5]-alanine N-acetyltransferase